MRIVIRIAALLLFGVLILGVVFYANPIGVADQRVRFNLWREGAHSRYIQVDGYRIHYFEAGSLKGVPLLLIHGLGSRGEDWATLIPAFTANGFHVYAPDLLGYGRSDAPDVDYSISLQEKLVSHFMGEVGLQKADVAGWSMGGWVAAKLTIDQPNLVDRLVLYDSAGIYFPATFDASLFTPTDRAGLDRLVAMLQPMPQSLPNFMAQAAVEKLQRGAWVITRSVSGMFSGRDLLDFRLRSIDRPTLIVWGSKDTLIPPLVGESMHHLIPRSSLTIIEGCGHLAPAQCSTPTVATTLQFLKSNPPIANQEQSLPGH